LHISKLIFPKLGQNGTNMGWCEFCLRLDCKQIVWMPPKNNVDNRGLLEILYLLFTPEFSHHALEQAGVTIFLSRCFKYFKW